MVHFFLILLEGSTTEAEIRAVAINASLHFERKIPSANYVNILPYNNILNNCHFISPAIQSLI